MTKIKLAHTSISGMGLMSVMLAMVLAATVAMIAGRVITSTISAQKRAEILASMETMKMQGLNLIRTQAVADQIKTMFSDGTDLNLIRVPAAIACFENKGTNCYQTFGENWRPLNISSGDTSKDAVINADMNATFSPRGHRCDSTAPGCTLKRSMEWKLNCPKPTSTNSPSTSCEAVELRSQVIYTGKEFNLNVSSIVVPISRFALKGLAGIELNCGNDQVGTGVDIAGRALECEDLQVQCLNELKNKVPCTYTSMSQEVASNNPSASEASKSSSFAFRNVSASESTPQKKPDFQSKFHLYNLDEKREENGCTEASCNEATGYLASFQKYRITRVCRDAKGIDQSNNPEKPCGIFLAQEDTINSSNSCSSQTPNSQACCPTCNWVEAISNCSKTCGGGVGTKTFSCQAEGGVPKPDAYCLANGKGPKPASQTEIACNTQECCVPAGEAPFKVEPGMDQKTINDGLLSLEWDAPNIGKKPNPGEVECLDSNGNIETNHNLIGESYRFEDLRCCSHQAYPTGRFPQRNTFCSSGSGGGCPQCSPHKGVVYGWSSRICAPLPN